MKIVVADPVFLPEEYRTKLKTLGELEVYDTVPRSQDEFVERVKDAEVVIVGRYGFSSETLRLASKLKMISLWQTGYDNVDLEAANEQGVIVSNVPNYAFDSVAEFSFALALDLERKVRVADMNLRKGKFDWRYHIGSELMSKIIGVIGTGNIGRRVIQIAHGFNMNVLSTTSHPNPERAKKLGAKFVDLDTLLSESDIVTLHVPLTPETKHMIGADELAKMKPNAILINTARGKIVDEAALVKALREKKIAGAGLDVFEKEPLPLDSPLLELENAVLTPHIAFLSAESIDECTYICVENVEMFMKGKPQNVVNPTYQ
ncbi:MAG: phosphoglycerate dehydrogenase [Methanotrichaceae archaeon]|nr:phosphoglycerate dehydrogenase [Methanotrichaceae archaeon]MDD1758025.1 phosphoglycerate dehydrogenase [Methanotrichaceae archaeon]